MFDGDRLVFLDRRTIQKHTIDAAENEINRLLITRLSEDGNKPIVLCITSQGGLVNPVFDFYERARRFWGNSFHTIALDVVRSAAVDVFFAGGQRFVTPNAKLIFHDVSFVVSPRPSSIELVEVESLLQELEPLLQKARDRSIQIVLQTSEGRLSRERIAEMMDKREILCAEDAVRYGLAHEMVSIEEEKVLRDRREELRMTAI